MSNQPLQLSPQQRAMLNRMVLGKTYKEIAEDLGVVHDTVVDTIARAREANDVPTTYRLVALYVVQLKAGAT